MDTPENGYHISFFKPTTPSARRNRNMVIELFLIWVVAIFGFQVLLRILQKPVTEPSYEVYTRTWEAIQEGNCETETLQAFAGSVLKVLGKVSIAPADRNALDNAFSWAVYNTADSMQRSELSEKIKIFRIISAEISDLTDNEYKMSKQAVIAVLLPLLGVDRNDAGLRIAPLEFVPEGTEVFTDENQRVMEAAMPFYLTHNRSSLTDTRFLGFPFHYFYTAIFLLILFVGLCWLYCIRTDMFNRKYNIED